MTVKKPYKYLLAGFFGLAIVLSLSFLKSSPVFADVTYNGGSLIDNGTLLDTYTMDASDIQSFLVSKGGALANYTTTFDCSASLIGATSQTAYQNAGAPCGQTVSASTIIYYASKIYGINPQVILATMQKEQSIVTATNPAASQYNQAMGYDCPDSGGCGASNFMYQVDGGTWALRFNYERANGNMTYWRTSTSWSCGSAHTYYSPSLYPNQNVTFSDDNGTAYSTVYMSDAATSSLYCYTPHALNNFPGCTPAYGFSYTSSLPTTGSTGLCYAGSGNFVKYFNLWFVPRDATLESVTNASPWLEYGTSQQVTITVRNIGSETWCSDGNCTGGQLPTRLVAAGFTPFSFYDPNDPNWVSSSQVRMQEATVPPGSIGTFTFDLTAPWTVTADSNQFYLMIDSTQFIPAASTWVGAHSYATPMTLLSKSLVNATLLPGQTTTETLSIRNDSTTTWYSDANLAPGRHPMRLYVPGYQASPFYDPDDPAWLAPSQIAMQTPTVAPGQDAIFQFTIAAPMKAMNSYYQQLVPVIDGEAVLPDIYAGFVITVPQPQLSYSIVSMTSPSGALACNATDNHQVTLVLKNTGNIVWRRDGSTALYNHTRLVWANPFYRSSAFYDSSDPAWLAPSQIAMQTDTVNPGDTGTFTFNWKAPSKAGNYLEYFGMVEDGYDFFPFYGHAFRTIVSC